MAPLVKRYYSHLPIKPTFCRAICSNYPHIFHNLHSFLCQLCWPPQQPGKLFFVEVKWSANNSRLNEGEQLQQPSAPPLPGSRVATLMAPGGSELAACSNNAQQLFIKNCDEFYICTIIYLLLIYYLFVCDIDIWNNIDNNVIAIMQSPIHLRSPQVAVSIDLNSYKFPSKVRPPDLGRRYDISHEWDNWDNWDKPRPAQEDDLRSSCQQPGNKTSEEKLST